MKNKQLIFSRRKKDFRVDYFRGSGPGGQHRNKKDTACRISDIETGLSSDAQDSKSREQNKKKAFRKLVKKLVDHYTKKEEKERPTAQRATRSYNEPEDRVTDHVTGDKFSYKYTIGKGDMSEIIEARLMKVKGGVLGTKGSPKAFSKSSILLPPAKKG